MIKNLLCLLFLVLAIFATYIFTPRPYMAHHHANFAVYIDGSRFDFSPEAYMEEITRCNITE
jgi:hypothetical protein